MCMGAERPKFIWIKDRRCVSGDRRLANDPGISEEKQEEEGEK